HHGRVLRRAFPADSPAQAEVRRGVLRIAISLVPATARGAAWRSRMAALATALELGQDDLAACLARPARSPGLGEDPYQILGVSPTAPTGDVKAAWRRRVRQFHPDGLGLDGVTAEQIKAAERALARVNQAYARLRADKRAA
ncbi:MAG: J domain-containing protein, partial [Alphaproteobacteria bacterium]